jgi:predicted methyltransferase
MRSGHAVLSLTFAAFVSLSTLATLAGCGGGNASVPDKLTIPIPPGPSAPTSTPDTSSPSVTAPVSSAPVSALPDVPHATVTVTPRLHAIVDAKDRTDDDRKIDAGRHPAELLAFLDLKPGMKVAELGVGLGYTTELLARAVMPGGKVWAQNSKWINERFADKPWSLRLKTPAMKNVVRVDRDFDEPLPPDAKDLDAVVINLLYHDTFWFSDGKIDRDKMNRAVFAALKKGGEYVVVDHSGRPGSGIKEVQTLHRIEESVVRDEVQKAGFKLAAQGDFLRNPGDTRDWNDAPGASKDRRGTSDRVVLKFVKP